MTFRQTTPHKKYKVPTTMSSMEDTAMAVQGVKYCPKKQNTIPPYDLKEDGKLNSYYEPNHSNINGITVILRYGLFQSKDGQSEVK